MESKPIPKGQSPEANGDEGQAPNPRGVYRHAETGKELTALTTAAADGFVSLGLEYKGPVPDGVGPSLPADSAAADKAEAKADAKEAAEAQKAVEDLKNEAAEEAAKVKADAVEAAKKAAEDAQAAAQKTVNDAKAEADKVLADAKAQAEKIVADARASDPKPKQENK